MALNVAEIQAKIHGQVLIQNPLVATIDGANASQIEHKIQTKCIISLQISEQLKF